MSNNKTKLYAFPVKNPSEIEAIRNMLKTKNIENLLYEFNVINDSNKHLVGDLYIEYIEVPVCPTGPTGVFMSIESSETVCQSGETGPTGSFIPIGFTGITGLSGDNGITGPFKPRETSCQSGDTGPTGAFMSI